jgi:ribose transport system permease protein
VFILAAFLSIVEPTFSSMMNYRNILLQSTFTAIIAVGMTFVIGSSGIDISVGMNVFLMISLMYVMGSKGISVLMSFIIAVIGATLIGVLNGLLICKFKIVPMIATLSTMTICRGVSYLLIDSKVRMIGTQYRVVGMSQILGIPVPILIMIATLIIGSLTMRYTRFGRYVLAVGNSETSAKETKINIDKVRFGTYALCGFCVGIAALIYAGRLGMVQTDSAYGVEFTVITAVVLGGTSLSGGRGTVLGSVIGCVFLTLIENALSLLEVSGFYYDVVRGVILFIALAIEAFSHYRQNKALIAQRTLRLRVMSNKSK